jgi:hypothetical protein
MDRIDVKVLLGDVTEIADEVDSQLAQAMSSYMFEANMDGEQIDA